MDIIIKVLLWIWQLPQNCLGFLLSRGSNYIDGIYFKNFFKSGVSLGDYIILDTGYLRVLPWNMNTVRHEKGHSKQSKILGPLYLIVIGIPSLVGNILFKIFKWPAENYYKQPWEAWADKLGGVKRNKGI